MLCTVQYTAAVYKQNAYRLHMYVYKLLLVHEARVHVSKGRTNSAESIAGRILPKATRNSHC